MYFILLQGYNFYKKFLLIRDYDLQEIVPNKEDRDIILKSLERDRPKGIHLSCALIKLA